MKFLIPKLLSKVMNIQKIQQFYEKFFSVNGLK